MIFKNVSALITGGNSGLGKATADLVLKHGGSVAVADLVEKNTFKAKTEKYKKYLSIKADVSKIDDVRNCFDIAYKNFGKINLVVNCAGIAISSKLIGKEKLHSSKLFKKVLDINLLGTFNVIKIASSKMQYNKKEGEGHRGVIINTSSIAAFDGQIGQAAYSASKGGIASMTLPIARELARFGIRVCSIAPGLFETPMLSKLPERIYNSLIDSTLLPKRFGNPKEYAQLVKAIYENDMLNGETIRLDGSVRLSPK